MDQTDDIAAISRRLIRCRKCPRLVEFRERVAREKKRAYQNHKYWGKPVPGFGDPRARLLLVGLAPGAHGSNRTGRMFTGDASGDWLYDALHRYGFANQAVSTSRDDGLRLKGCYITAAARCVPPGNKPTRAELDTCRGYLETELRLLERVGVVVALGRVGYEAWLKAAGWWGMLPARERPKFAHGAEAELDGVVLLCSYHPSQQNTNTGKLTRRMWYGIFERARELLRMAPAQR
jgi:uracil-DNA glycosylase family 4